MRIKNKSNVRIVFVTVAILALGVSQGFSADWSSILKELKAKDAKFEKEIKDMTIVQETKMVLPKEEIPKGEIPKGKKGEMVTEAKILTKGKKFRMETMTKMPEMSEMPKEMMEEMQTTIIIDDGKDMWMISPLMGPFMKGKKKLSDKERKAWETDCREKISENAKIVGEEKVGKRSCYVVEIKEQREEVPFTKIWLDKENIELIKTEIKEKEPKGKRILVVHHVSSDFRKIKGDLEMAYKTEMYVDDNLISTTVIKSCEINKGLSDDLFDPDKVLEMKRQKMMQKEETEEYEQEKEDEQEEVKSPKDKKPGVKDLFERIKPW